MGNYPDIFLQETAPDHSTWRNSAGNPEFEVGASRLIRSFSHRKQPPLIWIHGESGIGKTEFASDVMFRHLKRVSPTVGRTLISVSCDDSASGIVERTLGEIVSKHPGLRVWFAKNPAEKTRMLDLVKSSPTEAAKRLSALLRKSQRASEPFGPRTIRQMVVIDGIDRLYCDKVGFDRPGAAVCLGADEPMESLKALIGNSSLLFLFTSRNWVGGYLSRALHRSGIPKSQIVPAYIGDFSEKTQAKLLGAKLSGIDRMRESNQRNELRDQFAEELEANPDAHRFLDETCEAISGEVRKLNEPPGSIDFNKINGLSGMAITAIEKAYQTASDTDRKAIARIFRRMIREENDGEIAASQLAKDPLLWRVASDLTDQRLLVLKGGDSLATAHFVPVSKKMLTDWERISDWERERSPSDALAEQFENHALSWELSGRNEDLLLHVDESMNQAHTLLLEHSQTSILSPLAVDFLRVSIEKKKAVSAARRHRRLNVLRLATAAVLAALLIFVGMKMSPEIAAKYQAHQLAKAERYALENQELSSDFADAPDVKAEGVSTESVSPAIAESKEIPTEEETASKPSEDVGELMAIASKIASDAGPAVEAETILIESIQPISEIDEPSALAAIESVEVPESSLPEVTVEAMTPAEVALVPSPELLIEQPVEVAKPEEVKPMPEPIEEKTMVVAPAKEEEEAPVIEVVKLETEPNKEVLTAEKAELPPVAKVEENPVEAVDAPVMTEPSVEEEAPLDSKAKTEELIAGVMVKPKLLPVKAVAEVEMLPEATVASDSSEPVTKADMPKKAAVASGEAPKPQPELKVAMEKPEAESHPAAKPVPAAEAVPEIASASEILDQMHASQSAGNVEEALAQALVLFELSQDDATHGRKPSVTSDQARQLTLNLGKIALMQNDQQAARTAWRIGIGGIGAKGAGGQVFSEEMRILMARTAMNSGREEDVSAFLTKQQGDAANVGEVYGLLKAGVQWSFGEKEKAKSEFRKLANGSADLIFKLEQLEIAPGVRKNLEEISNAIR